MEEKNSLRSLGNTRTHCIDPPLARQARSRSETTMTASTTQAANGLITHDAEGRDNVDAKEPPMQLTSPEAGWGFHERAERLNGRLAMLGFVAAIATELLTGEGLLQAIGL